MDNCEDVHQMPEAVTSASKLEESCKMKDSDEIYSAPLRLRGGGTPQNPFFCNMPMGCQPNTPLMSMPAVLHPLQHFPNAAFQCCSVPTCNPRGNHPIIVLQLPHGSIMPGVSEPQTAIGHQYYDETPRTFRREFYQPETVYHFEPGPWNFETQVEPAEQFSRQSSSPQTVYPGNRSYEVASGAAPESVRRIRSPTHPVAAKRASLPIHFSVGKKDPSYRTSQSQQNFTSERGMELTQTSTRAGKTDSTYTDSRPHSYHVSNSRSDKSSRRPDKSEQSPANVPLEQVGNKHTPIKLSHNLPVNILELVKRFQYLQELHLDLLNLLHRNFDLARETWREAVNDGLQIVDMSKVEVYKQLQRNIERHLEEEMQLFREMEQLSELFEGKPSRKTYPPPDLAQRLPAELLGGLDNPDDLQERFYQLAAAHLLKQLNYFESFLAAREIFNKAHSKKMFSFQMPNFDVYEKHQRNAARHLKEAMQLLEELQRVQNLWQANQAKEVDKTQLHLDPKHYSAYLAKGEPHDWEHSTSNEDDEGLKLMLAIRQADKDHYRSIAAAKAISDQAKIQGLPIEQMPNFEAYKKHQRDATKHLEDGKRIGLEIDRYLEKLPPLKNVSLMAKGIQRPTSKHDARTMLDLAGGVKQKEGDFDRSILAAKQAQNPNDYEFHKQNAKKHSDHGSKIMKGLRNWNNAPPVKKELFPKVTEDEAKEIESLQSQKEEEERKVTLNSLKNFQSRRRSQIEENLSVLI